MNDNDTNPSGKIGRRPPWNKGKLIGPKPPLRPSHVWSIRTKLQMGRRMRDLALFNLAIDSKLRGCDVVAVRVDDVAPNGYTLDRATVRQKKTGRPVRFEMTEQTRQAIDEYLRESGRQPGQFLFAGRGEPKAGLTTRQYARLAGCQSARQVHLALREEVIELPAKGRTAEAAGVVWRLPRYSTVINILTNPIYAGAYTFGRTGSKVTVEDGRKCIRRGIRRDIGDWDVLLKEQHEGYISWEEFEHNQRIIANNGYRRASGMAMGAARDGELLLTGLMRCGHCGRKLQIHYSKNYGRYNCYLARHNHGTQRCISIGGLGIDAAVSAEVLRILKPLGIEAAVKATEAQASQTSGAERQLGLALTQARYEAAHARRQYDAVDPANRLVAGELERRWNAALENVQRIEGEIAAIALRIWLRFNESVA